LSPKDKIREYQVNIATGLLEQASVCQSPNFNERSELDDIDTLVIHGISLPPGQFGDNWINALFLNKIKGDEHPEFKCLKDLKVSSHLLIRRDGEVIQYVPFNKRAWHAGQSSFQGRENCNDFSIGIELEGTDDVPYEHEQYSSLALVTNAICKAYKKITLDRVVGHCDIAPGRKTDPGKVFNWDSFRQSIKLD